MKRTGYIRFLGWLAAALAVLGAAVFQQRLDSTRVAMDTVSGEELTQSYPQVRALQILPGTLRTVLMHWLWIRSEKLKNEGTFYESDQLARMICALEARYPHVWDYHAWNLAYNVSVQRHTPQERWHWVTAGIKLLRDQGLRYNPKSLTLYRSLSFIYWHKLGGRSDEMHHWYKQYHAGMYHRVLGAPPRGGGEEAYIQWFAPVVEASDTLAELLDDAETAQFVTDLQAAGVAPDMELLDAYAAWGDDAAARMISQPISEAQTPREVSLQRLMTDPELAKPRAAAVAFARKRILTETYKLKPAWMLELVRRYGPMDFRLVQPHGLYWSSYGVHHVKGYDVGKVDSLNTYRNIITSLRDMTTFGRIVLEYNPRDRARPIIMESPNWDFIDVVNRVYVDFNEFITGQADGTTYESFIPGHMNYLAEAIVGLYQLGETRHAQRVLQYVRDHYKTGQTKGFRTDRKWQLPLDAFVHLELTRSGMPRRAAMFALISGSIQRAYTSAAMGDIDQYQRAITQASNLWQSYDDSLDSARQQMLPLPALQGAIVSGILDRLTVPNAKTVWDLLGDDVQSWAYDAIAQYMVGRCRQANMNFQDVFPAPVGLKRARAERARLRDLAQSPKYRTPTP